MITLAQPIIVSRSLRCMNSAKAPTTPGSHRLSASRGARTSDRLPRSWRATAAAGSGRTHHQRTGRQHAVRSPASTPGRCRSPGWTVDPGSARAPAGVRKTGRTGRCRGRRAIPLAGRGGRPIFPRRPDTSAVTPAEPHLHCEPKPPQSVLHRADWRGSLRRVDEATLEAPRAHADRRSEGWAVAGLASRTPWNGQPRWSGAAMTRR